MPYRIDLTSPPDDALDRLIELGALDVEVSTRGIAALIPDAVHAGEIAAVLGIAHVPVSPAVGRDDDSVWVLTPRPVTAGGLLIVPAGSSAPAGALQLLDGTAFGTGLHPTTALCIDAIRDAVDSDHPDRMLDVGTGSGVLALAALMLGVPRATGVDVDEDAIAAAAANAGVNGLATRLDLIHGGPDVVDGAWPLIVANVLPAALVEMAPVLVRRMAHAGRLVISGIPATMAAEVERVYVNLGMRRWGSDTRAEWTTAVLRPSW